MRLAESYLSLKASIILLVLQRLLLLLQLKLLLLLLVLLLRRLLEIVCIWLSLLSGKVKAWRLVAELWLLPRLLLQQDVLSVCIIGASNAKIQLTSSCTSIATREERACVLRWLDRSQCGLLILVVLPVVPQYGEGIGDAVRGVLHLQLNWVLTIVHLLAILGLLDRIDTLLGIGLLGVNGEHHIVRDKGLLRLLASLIQNTEIVPHFPQFMFQSGRLRDVLKGLIDLTHIVQQNSKRCPEDCF